MGAWADLQETAIEHGGPARHAKPAFVRDRLVQDAKDRHAILAQGDERSPFLHAGDEGARAVDRVQHPHVFFIRRMLPMLFAVDAMIRIVLLDQGAHDLLGLAVGQRYGAGVVLEADILNLFNEANELDRENSIANGAFSAWDADNGLITQAQEDACALSGNISPCLLAAYANFQNNGAPIIAAAAVDPANRFPLFNYANSFQGPRTIRLGFRFIF